MTSEGYDRFKIVLLGESSVGKTCLLRRLVDETFTPQTVSTIGVDFRRKKFIIHNRGIELEIWDTAGQEKFRTITSFQYRNARGILLVYDITNRLSFERMRNYWLRSISEHAGEDHLIPVFLAGNKLDLVNNRQVSHAEGHQAHVSCSAYDFFETSSKTGENVQALFSALAAAMFSTWKPLLCAPPVAIDGVCVDSRAAGPAATAVIVAGKKKKIRKQKQQQQQQQQQQRVQHAPVDRSVSFQLHNLAPPVSPPEKSACCKTG